MYKNLPKQVVLQLKDLVQYQPGQVVSRTLVQNDRVSMTLFSFDQGKKSLPTHPAETPWLPCWRGGAGLPSAERTFC